MSAALAFIFFSCAQLTFAQNVKAKAQSASINRVEVKRSFISAERRNSVVGDQGNFILYEPITQASVLRLTMTLEEWSAENPDSPLRLMLNSPGGDVLASFALVDELNHLRNKGHKLTIAVYGMAASAAAWVLQAADYRIIGANSTILIHEVSSGSEGPLSEMKASIARSQSLQDQFLKLLAKRSRLTVKLMHARIDGGKDWWLSADEAKKFGLVDEIENVPAPAN